MSHLSSIGAGMFSDLALAMPSTPPDFATLDTKAEFDALFATEIESSGGIKAANTFVRVKNVREFPSLGTPPNIVNVPVYGAKTSQQIQGQSDSPNLELTINLIASDWADATLLGAAVGDGNQYVFRFALMNTEPTGYDSTTGTTGIGSVENSVWYFIGKIEALLLNPQLTDANTATLTLSAQSEFFGIYTVDAA